MKRFLGILLSLVMVLGLVPGMSLTAYADGHIHNFTYSASGDTITATCNSAGCNLTENKVTLTIGDPTNIYWDDKSSSHEFTLVGLEAFNSATGKSISANDIVYYKGDNTTPQIRNNDVRGTTYKARLTVEGARAEHSFLFTAKPSHTHQFSYTANGATITATCTSTTGNCDLPNKQATLTLNAPLHKAPYGDNAFFTGSIPGVTNPTIYYRRSDTPLGTTAPTEASKYPYTAWCQLGNATASVEYRIRPDSCIVTYWLDEGKNEPYYAQDIVRANGDGKYSYKIRGYNGTPPAGKSFLYWQGDDGVNYHPENPIEDLYYHLVLTAVWREEATPTPQHQGGGSLNTNGDLVFFGGSGADDGWEYIGGYVPQRAYRVSFAPMQGGSAYFALNSGETGETMNVYPQTTVWVRPTPAPGYRLASIVWSMIDGSASYDITQAQNFVMPAMDVVVYVTFQPIA